MAIMALQTTIPLLKPLLQPVSSAKLTPSPVDADARCGSTSLRWPSQFSSLLRRVRIPVRAAATAEASSEVSKQSVRIVAVVGEASLSPIRSVPWVEVMRHTASRLKWVDEGYQMLVFSDNSIQLKDLNLEHIRRELVCCDMLVNVAVKSKESVDWLLANTENIPNIICFDSSSILQNKVGGLFVSTRAEQNMFSKLGNMVKPTIKKESEVIKTVHDAWERYNTDDIRFSLLVIVNAYIKPVPILKNLRAKGLSTINCMLTNCGSEVLNCLFDPNCRKALQCLNACSPTDQVCSYRCIASYESPYLEAFSLCVLQKHNCLELSAEVPCTPSVEPMSNFRGEIMNHETAEDLFIGWLGKLEWSWQVVAGLNPAYDQFPCQFQLFYRGKAKGTFWYEPVFQVKTLEGELVWRRRKYRVRRGKIPGTFYFSVLDSGVVSKEFWTIVDVCEDLSWGLFHYHGAAQAAGQSYTGAVLATPDGKYPTDKQKERMLSSLEKCDIKEWELHLVDNCSCVDPPLGLPEGSSLHHNIIVSDHGAMYVKK